MKAYLILFSFIVIAGFAMLGVIIYNGIPHAEMVYLNTVSRREATNGVIDSVNGPSVIAVFPCNRNNTDNDPAPWADLYLCHSYSKADSLSGDTLVMFLDTHTKNDIEEIEYPGEYWTEVKKEKKYDRCKVLIPRSELDSLKKYRYKYGDIKLVTTIE